MDQRDSHCPYSLSSEITAKPTVLGFVLVCHILCHVSASMHFTQSEFIHFIRVQCLVTLRFQHFCAVRATAGQEDPFELDSNLLLSSGRHGEDRKRQYIHLYDHETPLLDDLADLLY